VVPGGCRSVSTFTFVGQLNVVVGFMLCGCASVFMLLRGGIHCWPIYEMW
jgi:hypothetical protein